MVLSNTYAKIDLDGILENYNTLIVHEISPLVHTKIKICIKFINQGRCFFADSGFCTSPRSNRCRSFSSAFFSMRDT